jgi:cell division protein FtsQ
MKRRVVVRRNKSRSKSAARNANPFPWRKMVALVGVVCFGLVILGVISLWRSGWVQKEAQMAGSATLDVTRRAGFAVNDIMVEGRTQTDQQEILQTLDVEKGSPILAFDPHEALQRLSTISWVKAGVVERRLPNTIFVKLTERQPIAIWQIGGVMKLVDDEGHVLRDLEKDEELPLPHVVGAGANVHAADLIGQLANYPAIMRPMTAAVRVSDRRWNLNMENSIIIKLPEENIATALQRLNDTIATQHILDRDITGLDLRLPDRMIVETAQDIKPPEKTKKIEPKL